ncbi:MAG: histidine triad family protein, partial [Propionibacteriaceae bacterium]|nr:histidine triad family protein [Propionibacteriaceae bacterium]
MTDFTADPDCPFCLIVAGTIGARTVYEDDHALSFLDLTAWQRGHTLVIPKRHTPNLLTGPSLLTDIAPAIEATARLLVDRLGADGLNLVSSAGEAAGQTVHHLHVHLVPRYADRPGLAHLVEPQEVSAAELDAV